MTITRKDRSLKDYTGVAGVGVAMGAADVVPGVSGGTMAFILGIYEELLATIKSVNITFVKLIFSFKIKEALDHVNWKFLAALGAGLARDVLGALHRGGGACDDDLSRRVDVGRAADLPLGGGAANLGDFVGIQAQNGRHRADPGGHGLLHVAAALTH